MDEFTEILQFVSSLSIWCLMFFAGVNWLTPKIQKMELSAFARGMVVGSSVFATPTLFVIAASRPDSEPFAFYFFATAFTLTGMVGRAALDAADAEPDASSAPQAE